MKILKKTFRYPLASIFLLFGLTIAFIGVFCGYSIFNYTSNLQKELNEYSYNTKNYIGLEVDECQDGIKVLKYLRTNIGNSMLNDIEVTVGNDGKMILADIIIDINEKLQYELESGRFISEEDINKRERVVNIGRNMIKDTYKKNKKRYIKINGDEYRVIGIIGTRNTKLQDNEVILYFDCIGNNLHKEIDKICDVVYSIASNNKEELLKSKFEEIKDNLIEDKNISVYEYEEKIVTSNVEREINEVIFFLLYFLGIINCIIVSEFWLLNRKSEIVIRLAFGFNERTLFKILYGDILKIATMAAFFGIIFSKLIAYALNNTLEMLLNFSVINCCAILLFVLVTTYILTKVLLRRIFSKNIHDYIFTKGVG